MVDNLYGYNFDKDFKIFEPDQINLGPMTFFFNVSASGAHIAFLECVLEDDASKNNCCFFPRAKNGKNPEGIEQLVGQMYLQNMTTDKLMKLPGGSRFFFKSRVNVVAPSHHKGGMYKMMWVLFGPQRGAAAGKKLTKKVEAKGFSDIDHNLGATPRERRRTTDPLSFLPKQLLGVWRHSKK